MKLIIDISEKDYKRISTIVNMGLGTNIDEAIKNGTPLPKRMLSVDLIIETLCQKDEDYDYPCIAPSYLEEELERLLLDVAPTIIESDKGE